MKEKAEGGRKERLREGRAWPLDGMLTLVYIQASCLGCVWEAGGVSPSSCLLQTGMPRDNRIPRMCRKVNRYEEHTEKRSQRMQAKGRQGLFVLFLRRFCR